MNGLTNIGVGSRPHATSKAARWALCLGVVSLGLLLVTIVVIALNWPFRYGKVKPLLQGVFSSNVEIDQFKRVYFPHPGFDARGLTFRRNSAPKLPPLGSAQELFIESNWTDMLLLRREIRLVHVVGLHVVIPPVGSAANREDFPPGASESFVGPTTAVDQFQIDQALLDIMRTNGQRYSFPIQQMIIRHLLRGHAAGFVVDMRIPKPNGRLRSEGSFGPLVPLKLGETPVSGKFDLSSADMNSVGSLHGMLVATGQFSGRLGSIEAQGTSRVADFAVGKGQPVDVQATGHAKVNALNGDVVLDSLQVDSGSTELRAEGKIAGSPAVTDLKLTIRRGRAEDILKPFLRHSVPVYGAAALTANAHVSPAKPGAGFLQRLKMVGAFDVPAEKLTDAVTEEKLTRFSGRVRKPSPNGNGGSPVAGVASEQPADADVISSIQGPVVVVDGVLSTRRLSFEIPGATATLYGTFDMKGGAVDLKGKLSMQRNISHAVTGWKSMLLRPLAPFFRKGKAGAVVPIVVTGAPGGYKVAQDVFGH